MLMGHREGNTCVLVQECELVQQFRKTAWKVLQAGNRSRASSTSSNPERASKRKVISKPEIPAHSCLLQLHYQWSHSALGLVICILGFTSLGRYEQMFIHPDKALMIKQSKDSMQVQLNEPMT